MQIQDKRVVVTGAASGIGKALAFKYAEESSNLIIIARNKKSLL